MKQLREALGYGCDAAVLLSDRKLGGADALATSYTLCKGIEKMGGFDLVLLGNASDDGSTAHVPSQLGEWLGLPHLTDVIGFAMDNGQDSISAWRDILQGNDLIWDKTFEKSDKVDHSKVTSFFEEYLK